VRSRVEDLLDRIDQAVGGRGLEALDIYLAGGAALSLFWGSPLPTKDVDALTTRDNRSLLEAFAQEFGQQSAHARALGIYLDPVDPGLAPMHWGYRSRAELQATDRWPHLRIWRLDPLDLILSKLKRFAPKDRRDIRHLCDVATDRVRPARLLELFDSYIAGDHDGEAIRRPNLERVLAYLEGRQSGV